MTSFLSYLPTLGQLLYADFLTFKPQFKDKVINYFIWISVTISVMGYLLTSFGLRADFGLFIAATGIAASSMFEVFPRAMTFLADITGNKVISYDITLPIPTWLALARTGISDGLKNLIICISTLPFGLIFVWNQFNPSIVNWLGLACMIIVTSFFYAFFGILIASVIKDMSKIGNMWMRVIFPLWMLGGFQFTWQVLYAKSSVLGYIALLNPFLYTMEGMRAAILGQAGSLPLWSCVAAIAGFTVICGWVAIKNVMKRLDCV